MQNLGLPVASLKGVLVWKKHTLQEISTVISKSIDECCDQIIGCRSAKDDAITQQIFEFVDMNITDPELSLSRVAEKFGKSASHISLLFKNQKKIGYSGYVNQRRIQKAADLLLYGGMSIETVSHTVGYMNLLTFRRNFRKFTNRNPSEFTEGGSPHKPSSNEDIDLEAINKTPPAP